MKEPEKGQQATARLSVNVPREMFREIRRLAVDRDTTMTQIVMDALEAYLQKEKKKK